VVRDVRSGAASHEVTVGIVGVVSQPLLWLGFEPVERFEGVVVGGGESVFGGEAVVDGDDDGIGVFCEVYAGVVEEVRGGAEEDEAAAVEVKDEREVGGGGVWEEYAGEGLV